MSMQDDKLQERIMNCLEEILPSTVTVTAESNLWELGINSMTFIRLVVALEEALDIEIEDESIYLEHFRNVESIKALVSPYVSSS
ncbi:acyl carrier protein [Marinicrinis sediminis]|uniref:Acyl carrier protein n=1 Tax=Marinicrinis sediminis TaxID=1652465 RepID=A0ABW5RE44_9BACL